MCTFGIPGEVRKYTKSMGGLATNETEYSGIMGIMEQEESNWGREGDHRTDA